MSIEVGAAGLHAQAAEPGRSGPGQSGGTRIYFAPAKINLGLAVLGQRTDGYHELHSIMVPLTVGDELELTPARGLSLHVRGASLPTDHRNLVYLAAERYLHAASLDSATHGVSIVLSKALPLASGLGGGSTDAATTLMALARLYPAGLDLAPLAQGLGADVPFFLMGQSALAQGVGEVLTPLELPALDLVLVNPGDEISARDAYRWLDDEDGFTPALPLDRVLHALDAGSPLPIYNALQGPVAARTPGVRLALRALSAQSGLHSPLMSGSGSTCFALARSAAQAQEAAARLADEHPSWWVQPARSLGGR